MQKRYTYPFICILVVFILSACVRDKSESCQFHLRFKYDYNMDYVDKFLQQAKRLHLYIFDENENFVREIKLIGDELRSNQIDLKLPTHLNKKVYSFIAWVGVDDHHIIATRPLVGKTQLHELEVALNYNIRLGVPLEPLMVGGVRSALIPGKVAQIDLVKNTNTFRVAVRTLPNQSGEEKDLRSAGKFNLFIESNNTRYNRSNEIISDELMAYYPYFLEEDDKGFIAELNTLRLVEERHNYLVIERRESHEELMRIDLNHYLEDLRFLAHANMPTQEFLDREDEYAILIFVSDFEEFTKLTIEINGWLIRDQDHEVIN